MPYRYDVRDWEDRITRYLFARIDSIWGTIPSNEEAIDDFLAALTLSEIDLEWLALLYHILQPDGAYEYINYELSEYLSSLSRSSEGLTMRERAPRGRIRWDKTLMERYRRASSQWFVFSRYSKTMNSPENMLLKLYILEIHSKIIDLFEKNKDVGWVADTLSACEELLASTYLKDVDVPTEASKRMLDCANRNRKYVYQRLVALWEQYERAIYKKDVEAIKEFVSVGWIGPLAKGDLDKLFELYVLVNTLEAVEEFVFQQSERRDVSYGLVRPGGSHIVASFEGDRWVARIAFNRNPERLFGDIQGLGLYKQIIDMYEGLSAKERRPDISIHITSLGDAPEIKLIVEVKNTAARSPYANDSIYKAIGYLTDFNHVWGGVQQLPKIVLAFPSGIHPVEESTDSWLENDIVVISDNIDARISEILEHICEE